MRRPVSGEFVNVFEEVKTEGGKMRRLLNAVPRVLQQGEIHELFITDEKNVKPGSTVKKYSVLGQFEVSDGGMIRVGDSVSIGTREIGNVAGYEVCKVLRAPSTDLVHIMLSSDKKATGNELDLKLGDKIVFNPSREHGKEGPVKD
jgi:hypothetical protein